jgi:hypothetical protein
MLGALFSLRKQEKKVSAMQSPTVIRRPFVHTGHGSRQHGTLRKLHAHLRGWARSENLMATFSLVTLVTIVLVLVYQSMSI